MVSADRGISCYYYGHSDNKTALEILIAKEAKRRFDCSGKHLDCSEMFVISERVKDYSTDSVAIGQRSRQRRVRGI